MGQDGQIFIVTNEKLKEDYLEIKRQALAMRLDDYRDAHVEEVVPGSCLNDAPCLPDQFCYAGPFLGRYYQPDTGSGDMEYILEALESCRIEFPRAEIWYCGDYDNTLPLRYEGNYLDTWARQYVERYREYYGLEELGEKFAPLPGKPSDLSTHARYDKHTGLDINLNISPLSAVLKTGRDIIARFDSDGLRVNEEVLKAAEDEKMGKVIDEMSTMIYSINRILEEA